MKKTIYATGARLSYYDLDLAGNLKLSALLRMAHIAADINAASLGAGYADLSRLGMTFVLQRIGFRFFGMPEYGETARLRTWPSEIAKGTFLRRGDLTCKNGCKLIEWTSLWILFDLNERKILKPGSLPAKIGEEGKLGVEVMPEKIALPGDLPSPYSSHAHTVRYADTDTNMHMNNSVYGDLIGNAVYHEGALPKAGLEFSEVQINYLAEARFGETIMLSAVRHEREVYVLGELASRRGFCARLTVPDGTEIENPS